MKQVSLYIHIPFCSQKCLYCDFNSAPSSVEIQKKYIDALILEIDSYKELLKNRWIKTIFIGGGTPSKLSPELIKILFDKLYTLNLERLEEFTIEINPETLNIEKLELYKKYGVNRLSFGVQSFNDKLLKRIGRVHSSEQAIKAIELAKRNGFTNINIDLMHNLPDMQAKDLYNSIDIASDLDVEHISLYSLILEEGTPLYNQYIEQKLNLMSEQDERSTFHKALKMLDEYGYNRYEISNFCRDKRCEHNMVYWKNEEYLGVGLSATGMYNKIRYKNIGDINAYIDILTSDFGIYKIEDKYIDDRASQKSGFNNKSIIAKREELTDSDIIFEAIMLGLRLVEGIDLDKYKQRYGVDILDRYSKVINRQLSLGTMLIEDGFLRLTDYGHDISNSVLVEFME